MRYFVDTIMMGAALYGALQSFILRTAPIYGHAFLVLGVFFTFLTAISVASLILQCDEFNNDGE